MEGVGVLRLRGDFIAAPLRMTGGGFLRLNVLALRFVEHPDLRFAMGRTTHVSWALLTSDLAGAVSELWTLPANSDAREEFPEAHLARWRV